MRPKGPEQSGSSLAQLAVALCLLLLCQSGLTPQASADIYRWRDAEGRWHFSDSPQNVPAQIREKSGHRQAESGHLNSVSSSRPSQQASAPQSLTSAAHGNDISIPFTAKEGLADRVIIDITFNDHITVPIMVDTGSPGLVIDSDLAADLNLLDADGNNLLVLISGIGGREVAARTIVDNLTIGKIRENFIPAHIISQRSNVYRGLIGMDILSQYALTIDSANHRLLAKKTASFHQSSRRSQQKLVAAKLQGIELSYRLLELSG